MSATPRCKGDGANVNKLLSDLHKDTKGELSHNIKRTLVVDKKTTIGTGGGRKVRVPTRVTVE